MADRHTDDDRRRWEDERRHAQRPEGDAAAHRSPQAHRGEPDISYRRHYSEGGRYAGGAPWGGRGDERYPVRDEPRAPQEGFSWQRGGPPTTHRGDRHDWRREDVGPPVTRQSPDRHAGPGADLHSDDRRGFWGRVKDGVRGRDHDEDRRVERRRVEPQAFRDDDDRPDRFDVEIADAVAAKLGRDRRLDSRYIEIAVYHGEVELTGSVLSKDGRRRAKQLAEQVRGVRDVDNHLTVEPWRF